MGMYYIAYAAVLIASVLPLFFTARWRDSLVLSGYTAVLLMLILMAGLRGPYVDRDYLNYLEGFLRIRSGTLLGSGFLKDPAFVAVAFPVAILRGPYVIVTTIFAALALTTKWVVGKYASPAWLLPLYMYLEFCRFFLDQDMTAIRAAVAIPIMSLSILLTFRKRWRAGVILFIIAILFHASAALGLPALLLAASRTMQSRKIFLYLAACSAIFYLIFQKMLSYVADISRLADYFNGNYNVTSLRLLSVYFLFRLAIMISIVLFLWHRTSAEDRFIVFCSAIGMAFQVVLSSNDTLALRSSEVFGIFDILMFLIPLKIWRFELRLSYYVVLLLMGAVFFNSSTKIMNPYRAALSQRRPPESPLEPGLSPTGELQELFCVKLVGKPLLRGSATQPPW